MSKQTAVEWLIDEIRNHIKEHGRLDAITISALRTMAKGTEKEQMKDFVSTFLSSASPAVNSYVRDEFEKYYKENYGQ